MTKDNGCSRYRLSYYTPRKYDLKRLYPWSTDVTHPGISSSKKQAVEATTNRPDFLQWSVYPLDKTFNHQSIPHQVRCGLASRPPQFLYMVDVPLDTGVLSVGMKQKNACQGDASVNSYNLREILNAKVNHVCDSKNVVSASKTNFLRRADDGRLLRSAGCNKYYGRFLWGNPCLIKDGNNTSMDVVRNEGLDLSLTLGQIYDDKKDIIVSGRADEGPMEHASGMVIADKKAFPDNVIVDYPSYAHLSRATTQANTVKWNAYQNNIPKHVICRGKRNVHLTVGCYSKEKGNIFVSGAVKVSANDEALLGNQNSTQSSEATNRVGTNVPNAYPSSEKNSYNGGYSREQNGQLKTAREPRPNLYPSSILCLLSTGIFDGAPVKYIRESRDLILCGVIKGSKILCSCNQCNNSEYIGPSKFERHAGGKTKRPNSHIYFENGRTIYEVFHELRNTSEDKFFYAIQKIAGSAVNQLNFHIWKGRSNIPLRSAPSPM